MMKLDHLRMPVTDLARSRAWYVATLGLKVEFEVPDRQTVALQDSHDFAIFLQQTSAPVLPNGCALWFQVTDVDATFAEWRRARRRVRARSQEDVLGIRRRAEGSRRDLIRLWDGRSMKEK